MTTAMQASYRCNIRCDELLLLNLLRLGADITIFVISHLSKASMVTEVP